MNAADVVSLACAAAVGAVWLLLCRAVDRRARRGGGGRRHG